MVDHRRTHASEQTEEENPTSKERREGGHHHLPEQMFRRSIRRVLVEPRDARVRNVLRGSRDARQTGVVFLALFTAKFLHASTQARTHAGRRPQQARYGTSRTTRTHARTHAHIKKQSTTPQATTRHDHARVSLSHNYNHDHRWPPPSPTFVLHLRLGLLSTLS